MVPNAEQLLNYVIVIPFSVCTVLVFTLALLCHILLGNPNKPIFYLPTLYYKESSFSQFLLDQIPRLRTPYYPPLWASNPHVQTIVTRYLLPSLDVYYERQNLQLKDKGLISLDWAVTCDVRTRLLSSTKEYNKLILLLPNLTDDALSVAEMSQKALSQEFRPIIYNRRGHGNTPLLTPKLQTYGDPSDLRQAIKYVRSQHPRAHLSLVGYGTGADLLLAYLGEYGSSAYMSAAVAISPLYDPESIYESEMPQLHKFIRMVAQRNLVNRHSSALSKVIDVDMAIHSRTIAEFEKRVYWKMCSCESWEQYWEKNAPLRDADEMSVPLLCVSSKDDPLVPREVIPYDVFQVYPQLILVETQSGGHCCFLQSGTFVPDSWANSLALDFLKVTLDFSSNEKQITKSLSSL